MAAAPKTVAQKARVKAGTRIAVLHPVDAVMDSLGLPPETEFVRPRTAQLLFVFVHTRAELETRLPNAVGSLAQGAGLWVFFRKGSRAAGLDMNRDDVWAAADALGLRPVGLVSVDDSWAVFRLRRGD